MEALINGYQYNGNAPFPTELDAKNAGLIAGNIYYNSTEGAMKQIQS